MVVGIEIKAISASNSKLKSKLSLVKLCLKGGGNGWYPSKRVCWKVITDRMKSRVELVVEARN